MLFTSALWLFINFPTLLRDLNTRGRVGIQHEADLLCFLSHKTLSLVTRYAITVKRSLLGECFQGSAFHYLLALALIESPGRTKTVVSTKSICHLSASCKSIISERNKQELLAIALF